MCVCVCVCVCMYVCMSLNVSLSPVLGFSILVTIAMTWER